MRKVVSAWSRPAFGVGAKNPEAPLGVGTALGPGRPTAQAPAAPHGSAGGAGLRPGSPPAPGVGPGPAPDLLGGGDGGQKALLLGRVCRPRAAPAPAGGCRLLATRSGARARSYSSSKTSHSMIPRPRPPYSVGQCTADHLSANMTACQARWASKPAAVASGGRGSEGTWAVNHARASCRKASCSAPKVTSMLLRIWHTGGCDFQAAGTRFAGRTGFPRAAGPHRGDAGAALARRPPRWVSLRRIETPAFGVLPGGRQLRVVDVYFLQSQEIVRASKLVAPREY